MSPPTLASDGLSSDSPRSTHGGSASVLSQTTYRLTSSRLMSWQSTALLLGGVARAAWDISTVGLALGTLSLQPQLGCGPSGGGCYIKWLKATHICLLHALPQMTQLALAPRITSQHFA